MKDIKRSCGLTLFAVIISVFYAVEHLEHYLLKFINSYFIFALFYLMVGSFMYVLDSGFFKTFTTGYRKLIKAGFLNQPYQYEDVHRQETRFLYTWPLIWSGLLGFGITLLISLTFF